MEFEASKLSFRALGDFVPQRTDSPAKADNEWQVAARAASAALSTYTTALRKKEIIVANKAITPVKEKLAALVAINTALVEKMNLARTSEADAQKRSALEDGVRKLKDETLRSTWCARRVARLPSHQCRA